MPLLYPEASALSVLLYAIYDPSFRETVRTYVGERRSGAVWKHAPERSLLLLCPQNEIQAERRIEWLVRTQNKRALALLESVYNEPKDVLFGIIGLAIIGPTLGLIKKRRVRNQMPVIISEENSTERTPDAAIVQAPLSVFEHELERAGNNMRLLEPDTHDWFKGDKSIALYKTSPRTIDSIKETLARLDIVHAEKDAGTVRVLAISPSVSSSFLESEWGLEAL